MNIIDAVKSGKRFRRPHWSYWLHIWEEKIVDDNKEWHFRSILSDLLADDWEVEEEKIEITKSQLDKLFENYLSEKYMQPVGIQIGIQIYSGLKKHLEKELGFK